MISRKVVPIGTSTRPTLLICPERANTFVPFDFPSPIAANAAAPFKKIQGMFA